VSTQAPDFGFRHGDALTESFDLHRSGRGLLPPHARRKMQDGLDARPRWIPALQRTMPAHGHRTSPSNARASGDTPHIKRDPKTKKDRDGGQEKKAAMAGQEIEKGRDSGLSDRCGRLRARQPARRSVAPVRLRREQTSV